MKDISDETEDSAGLLSSLGIFAPAARGMKFNEDEAAAKEASGGRRLGLFGKKSSPGGKGSGKGIMGLN